MAGQPPRRLDDRQRHTAMPSRHVTRAKPTAVKAAQLLAARRWFTITLPLTTLCDSVVGCAALVHIKPYHSPLSVTLLLAARRWFTITLPLTTLCDSAVCCTSVFDSVVLLSSSALPGCPLIARGCMASSCACLLDRHCCCPLSTELIPRCDRNPALSPHLRFLCAWMAGGH